MKKLCVYSLCLGCVFAAFTSHAIDLKQSKLTQVVNDVQIISAAAQKQKAAAVNDLFAMPDILRTGTASRAELVAQDETVTRVGANTIFSFDPANRTIDLKQGSLLFHSPHGKGGGTIHTGSATASVLGTTLIVTTTPNGGLKVLDLEGEVEVKFLSGLRQKLDPGQMTFILPGGNQLAPVIVFRLDELTQNSLLVKGFNQSLASLPLIQNQVEKQIKLIQSGKATDTGLYAGDDASPNQVEVLDVNTIPHNQHIKATPPSPPPPVIVPNLGAAEAADATINQPSLTGASIPTPPVHVFTGTPFPLTGNGFFNGQTFVGFVARNIFVNTIGTIIVPEVAVTSGSSSGIQIGNTDPLLVDLSPYTSVANFDLVSVNDFSIEGSVTFSGLSSQDNLALIAGHQFILSPGISVRADVKNLLLSSPAALTLDDVSVYNFANNITLNSGEDIFFKNGALVSAASKLTVNAGNDISAIGSHFIADSVLFTPLSGSVFFDGTTVDASGHVIFIVPTAINLNNSTINSDFVTLNGTANATISLDNTTINASSLLALAPISINVTGSALNADAGSGQVTLISSSGSVNITDTSITAHYLTVNSGDGILLDASGRTLTASGEGATASFTAPNLITVNNADFSSFSVLNMAANTIVLVGDTLAAISNFGTQTGLANFSGGVIPGEVNFFGCLTYLGAPVTSDKVTLSNGPGNALGIFSYRK